MNYERKVQQVSPDSALGKHMLGAFLCGGLICVIGQALGQWYQSMGASVERAGTLASVSLIFLAILLTGLGQFDNLARFGGAGFLVPITGFANAMSAPAMDYRNEGMVLGIGANLFKIAGPVLVYGLSAGVLYGVILYLISLF